MDRAVITELRDTPATCCTIRILTERVEHPCYHITYRNVAGYHREEHTHTLGVAPPSAPPIQNMLMNFQKSHSVTWDNNSVHQICITFSSWISLNHLNLYLLILSRYCFSTCIRSFSISFALALEPAGSLPPLHRYVHIGSRATQPPCMDRVNFTLNLFYYCYVYLDKR